MNLDRGRDFYSQGSLDPLENFLVLLQEDHIGSVLDQGRHSTLPWGVVGHGWLVLSARLIIIGWEERILVKSRMGSLGF